MIYADWPLGVPYEVERRGWSFVPARAASVTEMDGGDVRQRRGSDLGTMQWSRSLDDTQVAAFGGLLAATVEGSARFLMPVCLNGRTYELRVVQIQQGAGGISYTATGLKTRVAFTADIFPAALTPAVPVITGTGDQVVGTGTSGQMIEIDFGGAATRSVVAAGGAFTVDTPFLADGAYWVRARYAGGQWSIPVLMAMPTPLKSTLRAQLLGSASGVTLDFAGTMGGLILAPAAPSSQYLGPVMGATMFTRASTATRINAQGLLETVAANVPRMDYDPITKTLKGLRMEGARTNLFARSGDLAFTGTGGTGYASGSRSVSAFPGLLSGAGEYFTTLLPNNANGCYLSMSSSYTFTAGMTYTVSGYVIIEGMPTLTSVLTGGLWSDGINRFISMDTVAGAVSGAIAGKIVTKPAYKVGTIMGRDVLRWEITFTPDLTTNGGALQMYRNQTVMDGVTPAFHAFGLQFEVGAGASSYIPTSGTAVTRAADSCYLNTAGWLNDAEGSIVIDYTSEAGNDLISCSLMRTDTNGGLAQGSIYQQTSTSGSTVLSIRSYKDGASQPVISVGTNASFSERCRVGTSFKAGALRGCRNGGIVAGTTGFTMPTGLERLWIGNRSGLGNPLFGWIHGLKYFPTALSNAQLQALTA